MVEGEIRTTLFVSLRRLQEQTGHPVKVSWIRLTVRTNVLRFRDYIFSIIFNDRPTCHMIRPMISFEARKIDNKMSTFLEFSRSNTAGTLLVVI
jgi:hypothetical protein